MTAPEAIRLLMKIAATKPRPLGRLLYHPDKTGHSLLCRFLKAIAHYGPHGTFVHLDSTDLKAGGSLCSFGVQCGEPTKDYTRHLHERLEEFHHISRMLEASGALAMQIWENPRFSCCGLCKCGHEDEQAFPKHDPLCPYRVEHGIKVTIEEYKSVLEGRIQ